MAGLGILFLIVGIVLMVTSPRSYSFGHSMQSTQNKLGVNLIVFTLLFTVFMNIAQVRHKNNIVAYNEQIIVYQDRVNELLPQLTRVLKQYPGYESQTFKGISSKSMFIIPPELKSDKMTMALVKEIKEANDKIYDTRLDIIGEKNARRINYSVGKFTCIWISNGY